MYDSDFMCLQEFDVKNPPKRASLALKRMIDFPCFAGAISCVLGHFHYKPQIETNCDTPAAFHFLLTMLNVLNVHKKKPTVLCLKSKVRFMSYN